MRAVVFWEEGFPTLDSAPLDRRDLEVAFEGELQARFVGVDAVVAALADAPDLLVLPYGSAFPKSAWAAIVAYVGRGGNWVNLGGAPLTRPVRSEGFDNAGATTWRAETCQAQYAKELRLNHAFPIDLPPDVALRCPPLDVDLETHFHRFQPSRAWSAQVRFTTDRDFAHEGGSSGRREAVLRPLVAAYVGERQIAAPVVAIDRLVGEFAGGRCVLACCEGARPLPPDLVARLCAYACRPRAQVAARPSFACYYPGEQAAIDVRVNASRLDGQGAGLRISLRVYSRDTQKEIYAHLFRAEAGSGPVIVHTSPLDPGAPGLYIVRATVEAEGHSKPIGYAETGFWVYERALMATARPITTDDGRRTPDDERTDLNREEAETRRGHEGAPGSANAKITPRPPEGGAIQVSRRLVPPSGGQGVSNPAAPRPDDPTTQRPRDLFYRDGRPFPITGTTYMAGDTHRKFLFEPNPAVWDADFAAMSAAGVNLVRTGLWTGWRRAMLDAGAVDEGVLRAFAAFLLTARRYDIPIIFTFFAFLPEAWGGENPYLDPAAVAAQTEFVAAFARRFAQVDDLMWDFINEPSFSSPARVWSTRPNYDRFEQAAWAEWLGAQCVSEDEWRERWRLTPSDPLDLPALEDFQDRYIFQGTHPLRALDYRRFAQEKFADWAALMARVVRENGNPNQLVTVGQDEGGTGDRPNPWFYGPVVDFTSNHSWWQNDDLLWDSLITKTPDRPNLIEETGIMFVENPDGLFRRTPQEARNLLERKMALAFAGGCAGFVQWLWNTNVYMDSDNEVGIGLLRADGSEKPELEAFRGVASFFAANAHRMVGRVPEQVCVVIPHSNMFGVRDTATAATRSAVRALEYDFGLACQVVAEHRVEEIDDSVRLIVLPSPRVLTEACWQTLLTKAEAGATLVVTGFVEADEYWRPAPRFVRFGIETRPAPVAQHEQSRCGPDGGTESGDNMVQCEFRGDAIQKLEKATAADGTTLPTELYPCGRGWFVYCPLPVELSDGPAATRRLYALAATNAGVEMRQCQPGVLVRRVEFAAHTLVLAVNECGGGRSVHCDNGLQPPPGRIALAFVERATGKVVARYEPGGSD